MEDIRWKMEIKAKYQVEMRVKKMRSNKCSFGAGWMDEYFHDKNNNSLQSNISPIRRIRELKYHHACKLKLFVLG